MKVRIIKTGNSEYWYKNKINHVCEIARESEFNYYLKDGSAIDKQDAEVVEEENCNNCGLYVNQICRTEKPCLFNGYVEWQPIEPPMIETADPSKIVKGSEQRKTGTTEDAKHYMAGKQQPIEIMQEKMTNDQFIGFLLGNVIKYSLRINHKENDREDAGKCNQYSQWLCDVMDGKTIIPGRSK